MKLRGHCGGVVVNLRKGVSVQWLRFIALPCSILCICVKSSLVKVCLVRCTVIAGINCFDNDMNWWMCWRVVRLSCAIQGVIREACCRSSITMKDSNSMGCSGDLAGIRLHEAGWSRRFVLTRSLACFFCLYVVRGRPNLAGLSSEGDFPGSGVLTVGQAGVSAPPLGIAYGKVCSNQGPHWLPN